MLLLGDTSGTPVKLEETGKTLGESVARQTVAIKDLTKSVEKIRTGFTELLGKNGGAGSTQLVAAVEEGT